MARLVPCLVLVLSIVLAANAISVRLQGNRFTVSSFQGTTGPSTCVNNCAHNRDYPYQIRWGIPVGGGCSWCGRGDLQPTTQSGFGWKQTKNDIDANNNWYTVAQFAHFNNPIMIPGCAVTNHFNFVMTGSVGDYRLPTMNWKFYHVETCSVASYSSCWGGRATSRRDCWCGVNCICQSCPDRVVFEGTKAWNSNAKVKINGVTYNSLSMKLIEDTFWSEEVSVNPQAIQMRLGEKSCPASCTGPHSTLCQKKVCDDSRGVCTQTTWNADTRCSDGPGPKVCQWKSCVSGACKTDLPYPNPKGDSRCPAKATGYCRRQACVGTTCDNNIVWNDDTRCATEFLPTINGKKVRRECYDGKCLNGACSTAIKGSRGNAGGENAANHLGSCPMPANKQANCYWPYCDMTGQCNGDEYNGTPYPNYKPNYRPGYTCPIPAGKNPQCWFPRCISGNCGGDAWNLGKTCTPMASEINPAHNTDCIKYVCGESGSELGRCVPRQLPEKVCDPNPNELDTKRNAQCLFYLCSATDLGKCTPRQRPDNRKWPCKDNDLCTWDWCDSKGQCDDHEAKKCSTGDLCTKSWCEPSTGECAKPIRNGNACCPDGKIDPFEQCEVGINGADAQCCVDCYFANRTCTDNNECTTDACKNGKCVSTFIGGSKACGKADPSDICGMKLCVKDNAKGGVCQRLPDPSKNGLVCGTKPDVCNKIVCENGECVKRSDASAIGKSCPVPNGQTQRECSKFVCVEQSDQTAKCQQIPDLTQKCDDNNGCTTEKCVLDNVSKLGKCQYNVTVVKCPASPSECHGPSVCVPATGKCTPNAPLSDKPCTPKIVHNDTCGSYICLEGDCVRDCPCGNGRLDPGEECDWAIPHQAGCCDRNCTGCWCGNGRLDPGEECDYNIPNQTQCCNATCQGCYCGDGILQDDEECDYAIEKYKGCCNETCQGCQPVIINVVPKIVAPILAVSLAALGAVGAIAYFSLGAGATAAAPAAPVASSAAAVGGNNPLFQPLMGNENPLYSGGM